MLYRKISSEIENHFNSYSNKILLLEGARQIGKSYIIRYIGEKTFKNYIEINFVKDDESEGIFRNIHNTEDFYFNLSTIAGEQLGDFNDTLIFLDEIQHYPQFLTLLKFFSEERRFRFIASGSLLGITLRSTTSIPIGSIIRKEMYQLDFEEFIIANGFSISSIAMIKEKFSNRQSLPPEIHNRLLSLFKRYLLVGGMPDAVNEYLLSRNIMKIRDIQNSIVQLYKLDAAKYEQDYGKKLQIRRIYEMIPSQMENKKKRVIAKDIQDIKGARYDNYSEEFEYLVASGISLDVRAISNPHYPLCESVNRNLLKLYLNDVGILTSLLYKTNIKAILEDERSINLGSVYETVVAQELRAHGNKLFYYDNKKNGEVDFIIDDYHDLCLLPIEVKSGRDYTIHSALSKMISTEDYHIQAGIVFSNNGEIYTKEKITYLPIYFVMFLANINNETDLIIN